MKETLKELPNLADETIECELNQRGVDVDQTNVHMSLSLENI